jgi:hypothetical protein
MMRGVHLHPLGKRQLAELVVNGGRQADRPSAGLSRSAGARSLRRIAATFNGRSIPTERGGRWSVARVRNIKDSPIVALKLSPLAAESITHLRPPLNSC